MCVHLHFSSSQSEAFIFQGLLLFTVCYVVKTMQTYPRETCLSAHHVSVPRSRFLFRAAAFRSAGVYLWATVQFTSHVLCKWRHLLIAIFLCRFVIIWSQLGLFEFVNIRFMFCIITCLQESLSQLINDGATKTMAHNIGTSSNTVSVEGKILLNVSNDGYLFAINVNEY